MEESGTFTCVGHSLVGYVTHSAHTAAHDDV